MLPPVREVRWLRSYKTCWDVTIGDMTQFVHDCPRCGVRRTTFNVIGATKLNLVRAPDLTAEVFCSCRSCTQGTIFFCKAQDRVTVDQFRDALIPGERTTYALKVVSFVSARNNVTVDPPEHLPQAIEEAFREGASCASIECFNAAGTMYRLCVDMASRSLLPNEDIEGLTKQIRRSLGFRLKWLFETKRLDEAFKDLSHCIKEDGNDGAHAGTLKAADVEDLQDFTIALLMRMYTEPEKLRLAKLRREARRGNGP